MNTDTYEPIDEMSERDMMDELATIISEAKGEFTDETLVASLKRAEELIDAICNTVYDFLGDSAQH